LAPGVLARLIDGSRNVVVKTVLGSEGDRRQAVTIRRLGAGVIIFMESVGIDHVQRQTEGRRNDAFASLQRRGIYE
jgi:hypothetical protein